MTTIPEQAVIQADRDCAENAIRAWVLMGANDDAWPAILAQAFATYRLDVTNPADCGCGMGVLCFRDRREPALDKIAFAIIEGSAGLRAAEHAKEFQTGNWRDALRSAQAVSRLAHSQPASEELLELLREMFDAMVRYEMDVDADAPAAHRDLMERVLAALRPLTEPQRLGQEGEAYDIASRISVSEFPGKTFTERLENARIVLAALTPAQAEPVADDELTRGKDELRRLMDVIWRSEFRIEAPNWKPLDDLPGMVSQIDNMYAGVRAQRDQARWDLHNPPAPPQDREAVVEALQAWLRYDETDWSDSTGDMIAAYEEALAKTRAALPLLAEERGERS